MSGGGGEGIASQDAVQDPARLLRNVGLPVDGEQIPEAADEDPGDVALGDPDGLQNLNALFPPKGRGGAGGGSGNGRGPYGASASPITCHLSFGTVQRAYAYWAARAESDSRAVNSLWPLTLSSAQLTLYLEDCSFRDAAADADRAPRAEKPSDDRLYDWAQLHMHGIRELMRQEVEVHCRDASEQMRKDIIAALGPTLTDAQKHTLAELKVGE